MAKKKPVIVKLYAKTSSGVKAYEFPLDKAQGVLSHEFKLKPNDRIFYLDDDQGFELVNGLIVKKAKAPKDDTRSSEDKTPVKKSEE